jgi:hypothetical protein
MMSDAVSTILEHAALAGVLWAIIQMVLVPMINRLMNRIDALTDRMIDVLEKQDKIITQQSAIVKSQANTSSEV